MGIVLPCSLDHSGNAFRPCFPYPLPSLYFPWGWSICKAYTCTWKGGLIAVSCHLSTSSASAFRTLWSREQNPRIFFFKLAHVFKRNLSGPRSAFLSIMKLHIMFWCGMQAATIFKPRNNCTCHLLSLRDSGADTKEADGCFSEREWHNIGQIFLWRWWIWCHCQVCGSLTRWWSFDMQLLS